MKLKSPHLLGIEPLTDGEEGALSFAIDGGSGDDLRKTIFRAAVDNQWTLLELARESASLEDVFRHLTTGEES